MNDQVNIFFKSLSKFFGMLSVAGLFFMASCASTHSSQSSKVAATDNTASISSPPPVSSAQKIAAEQKLIEAKKMEILGDNQQAINLYKECLKIDPNNDAAYYSLAEIYLNAKQVTDAIAYAQKAVAISPTNKWYEDLYGTILGAMGNYSEASKVYHEMVIQDPDNGDAWYNYAFFLEQNKQYQDAINVFDQIEQRFGLSEEVSREKAQLWLRLNKPEKATGEIENLITVNPHEPRYYAMLIDLYMGMKQDDKAYQVVQQLLKVNPNDPQGNLLLAQYYSEKGQDQQAFEAYKIAFASPDLDIDMKVPLLVAMIPAIPKDSVKTKEAVELSGLIVQAHPKDAKAHAVAGDVYNQLDQFQNAIDQYNQSITIDNSKFIVWQQVMYLYTRINNFDSLQAMSKRAIDFFPNQSVAYYFNGYSNMELKHYGAAIDAFGHAAMIGSDDKKQLGQYYSNMGDAYHELKNDAASDSCYDLALVADSDDANVLNNYAYYLIVRGVRMEDAKKMADRSNSLSPNTAAYEDTYGWIFFKTGDYSNAKIWLEKAMENGGDEDGTVLEHYGDILYKSGDIDGAVKYWILARDKHAESPELDKKIAEKKLYD